MIAGNRRRVTLGVAVVSGLLGSTLLGAGAFAADGDAPSPGCPHGSVLYRPVLPPSETPVVEPVAGTAEAATDPFVAPGAPDPDSFVCIGDDQLVPALPGVSSPDAPYEAGDGSAVDAGTEVDYDPGTAPEATASPAPADDLAAPTPAPVAVPLQPAPGMVDLPGSVVDPVIDPDDAPSDPGPVDPGTGGGTVVLPGPTDGSAIDVSGSITRDQVIARAVSWVLQGVPYSQSSWWADSNGTYRQDCSGYVSMAWNLNQRTNYWTGNLANVSHRIATKNLKMGDILLLPRSHVVIFAGWANAEKTKFHLFEEYSRGKPARYLTGADLSYYVNRGYGAYRYDRIADVEPGKAGAQRTVYLSSYSEDLPGTQRSAADLAERELADAAVPLDLEAVAWSRPLAEQADAEEYAPPAVIGAVTPESVPDLPLETLVEAQLATDLRASEIEPASSGSGTVLLAAGLGLLFLAFPLTIAARSGAWNPGRPEETT